MNNKQLFFLCAVIIFATRKEEPERLPSQKNKPLLWIDDIENIYYNIQNVWKRIDIPNSEKWGKK